jgi:hypothetical protein
MPNFDVSKELKEIADKFSKILKNNIDKQIDIQEIPYAPNAASTTKYKFKKGLDTRVLIATRLLKNSITSMLLNKNTSIIYIEGQRNKVGAILQNQGTKSGRKFNFFGISSKMEAWAMDFMRKSIGERIKNA